MKVWRICRAPFADLDGEGARLYGGRWNSVGRRAVYAAESLALAALEVRVHLDLPPELAPVDYVSMTIDIPDGAVDRIVERPPDPRSFGDVWLESRSSLGVLVPSFAVAESWNVLINPSHSDAAWLKVDDVKPFTLDPRLWLPLRPKLE